MSGALPAPGGLGPLTIGHIRAWPPVVLAPMAGVTNVPFRRLCRSFVSPGGRDLRTGVFVSEMIGARALLEGDDKTRRLARFADGEEPRSIQLYGTDPGAVGEAVSLLVRENGADHLDLNFGCPVPKVTRHGGGAALPVRRELFGRIVRAAVAGAHGVPVTVKYRKGVDDRHPTYLDCGIIAEEEGAAAVALHARTAEQLYAGEADWDAIRRLKATVTTIPVLGNGDVFEPADGLRMMEETGCDGVVIGRGCLGRPWLFGELEAAFAGRRTGFVPRLGFVSDVMVSHARMLVEWFGETPGIRSFRRHVPWYLKGYPVGPEVRRRLADVSSPGEVEDLMADLDADAMPHPGSARVARGHTHGPRPVRLPHRYLEGEWDHALPPEAEVAVSGG